jgi:L-asparaginase
MTTRLIATGGTFDKVYDPLAGQLGFVATHLSAMLQRARVGSGTVVEALMQMDSLDMLDSHRDQVLQACRAATETAIVVVHGTDTLVDTAAVLADANLPATIVLTGAMVPYSIKDSDALFNLGHAIGCAQHLPPGVYVSMNGRARRWDDVRKNRQLGVFESPSEPRSDAG